MSDEQCGSCVSNADLKACLETNCMLHDTFIVRQLLSKLNLSYKYLRDAPDLDLSDFMDDMYKFNKLCKIEFAIDNIKRISNLNPDVVEIQDEEVDICDHTWNDSRLSPGGHVTSGEHCSDCGKLRAGNYTDTTFEPVPDYGDIMTVKEFTECCIDTSFIDSDGSGYYAVSPCGVPEYGKEPCKEELVVSRKRAYPSDLVGKKFDLRFSHVVWYNK